MDGGGSLLTAFVKSDCSAYLQMVSKGMLEQTLKIKLAGT
jgi:hypothetical protein